MNFEISNVLEFKSENGTCYFEGYLSTTKEDRYKDRITSECLEDMVRQLNASLQTGCYEHEWRKTGIRKSISKITEAKLDGNRIYVKGIMNKAVDNYEKLVSELQNGFLPYLSIEYRVPENGYEMTRAGRILRKIDLVGYAHTSIPVNPDCSITDVFIKSLEEVKSVEEKKEEKEESKENIAKIIESVEKEEAIKAAEVKRQLSDKDAKIKELENKVATFEKKESDKALEEKMKEIAKLEIQRTEPEKKVINSPSNDNKENPLAVKPFNFADQWNKAHGIINP